ncbi:amidophosphoribosyltransferase [Primorskyibacter sp. 2E233]|uniref:amidophosphoribosyltransferase n=1 Tax=Primorskyibacter sp. 2E233 TaxID=3413431 RepID=UPI003BF3A4BD
MLAKSLRPQARPKSLSIKASVASADDTPTNVQDIATTEVDLPANQPIVLGVFGKEDAPHALIRLPSGRIMNLTVGGSLGDQQVIAIAADAIVLSNSRRLHMP